MKIHKVISYSLSIFVIGGVFSLLVWHIYQNWEQIQSAILRLHTGWLLLSAVLFLASFGLLTIAYALLVALFDRPRSYCSVFRIWVFALMGKYLPGKVFTLAGKVILGTRIGIPVTAGGFAVFLELVSLTLAALLVSIPIAAKSAQIIWLLPGALIFLASAVFLLKAKWTETTLNYFRRLARLSPLRLDYQPGDILPIFSLHLIFWLLQGISVFCLLRGVAFISHRELPLIIGSYSLAYIVGIWSFFSPAGLGVREGILAILWSGLSLASGPLPAGLPAALALLSRVWATLLDGVLFLIAWLMPKEGGTTDDEK